VAPPATSDVPREQKLPDAVLVSNGPPLTPPPPPAPVPDLPPRPVEQPDSPGKLQAQQLVAESQRLLHEGRLLEARQKAVEAQRPTAVSTTDGAPPELVYQRAATEARLRVDALVRQANEEALFGQGAVATRCQNAERRLGEARQLATSFGHDVRAIDDKVAEVRRLRDSSAQPATNNNVALVNHQVPPPPPAPPQQPVDQGRLLLDNARLELKKGQTKLARTMGETVLASKSDLKDEAVALLRTIDVEEFNQKTLEVNRTFDAAASAYRKGNVALASSMITAIDTRLLTADRQQRLREMAMTPEMYREPGKATATDKAGEKMATLPVPPTGVMRTGDDGLPGAPPGGTRLVSGEGRATATDQGGGDVLDAHKKRMDILGQKLRRDGIDAQNAAADRVRAGDHDGALAVLNDYLTSLDGQELD